jgi:YidC/Oxa1 family membrane protein insertase
MPQAPNKLLRLVVPLIVAVAGIGVVIAVFTNTSRQTVAPPSPAPTGGTGPTVPTPATPPPTAPGATGPAAPQPTQPPTPPSTAVGDLAPRTFDDAPLSTIGSLDPNGQFEAEVRFSRYGAGIQSVSLARHFETIERIIPIVIQREHSYVPRSGAAPEVVTPLAAVGIEINGTQVPLLFHLDAAAPGGLRSVWRETAPGSFEALIANPSGGPVARIERRYTLTPGSFTIRLDQKVTNLTDAPLRIRWIQFGPADLDNDSSGYGGDKRRVRFGYLFPPESQKADPTVLSDEFHTSRQTVLGPSTGGYYEELRPIWPNRVSTRDRLRPVWVGMGNRYFGAAMLPIVPANAGPDAKVFHAAESVDRVLLGNLPGLAPVMILRTTSEQMSVAAGGTADLSMGIYVGPLERPRIQKDAATAPVGLDGLVLYNFGGICAPCTFAFLTGWLLALLRFLHNNIVFDWALSIMVLVLIVRTILHPVTKWSQIRLQRFGKQMQGMAPKQKKVQEKYKDDQKKMREEMAKLWREEGISPTGALGCIPMLLQTPVWIALYAMLYFAFELRHQSAFFGIFQSIIPGFPSFMGWFLGDLAEPDRFYYFKRNLFEVPLLGPISSINILPVILGVVFYVQQKYLTPPSTTPLTPEQEQQQKMMKWMMVFLFPLMMYNAPSGLALYFIVNSTLGILESRYIRAHINKYDLLKPKTPTGGGGAKPGGFMARLQKIAEERQKQVLKARGQHPPRKKV